MPESSLISGLLTLVVVCWFMIACPVGCFIFSIFSDSLNISGAFEKAGIAFTSVIMIPFFIFGKIVDAVTSPFVAADMRYAIDHRDDLK